MKLNNRVVVFPVILLVISGIFLLFFNEKETKNNIEDLTEKYQELNISEISLDDEDEEGLIITEELIKTEEPILVEEIIKVNNSSETLKSNKQMIVVEKE